MHLKEIRCVDMHWANAAQDIDKWGAVVNTLRNFRFQ